MPSALKTTYGLLSQFAENHSEGLTLEDYNADMLKIDALWVKPKGFTFSNNAAKSLLHDQEANLYFGTFEYSGSASSSNRYIESSNCLGLVVPAGYYIANIEFSVDFPGVSGYGGVRWAKIFRTKYSGGGAQMVDFEYRTVPTSDGVLLKARYNGCAVAGDIFTFTAYQASTQTLAIAIGNVKLSANFM